MYKTKSITRGPPFTNLTRIPRCNTADSSPPCLLGERSGKYHGSYAIGTTTDKPLPPCPAAPQRSLLHCYPPDRHRAADIRHFHSPSRMHRTPSQHQPKLHQPRRTGSALTRNLGSAARCWLAGHRSRSLDNGQGSPVRCDDSTKGRRGGARA